MTQMELFFLFGVALVSFGVTYSLWVKVRVARLRQDIFDKRDELFDIAMSLDAFNDPAYQEAREHLNALAHIAKYLSIPLMVHVTSQSPQHMPACKSKNLQLQSAIDNVFEWSAERIFNYLLKETVGGYLLNKTLNHAVEQATVRKQSTLRVETWIRSEGPVEIDRFRGNANLGHRQRVVQV